MKSVKVPVSKQGPFQQVWDAMRPKCEDCALGELDCELINPEVKAMALKCFVPKGTIFVADERPV